MKRIFLILCLITICNISYADIASVGYVDSVVDSLPAVAKTGSYNDLSNKPTIPNIPTGPIDGKKYEDFPDNFMIMIAEQDVLEGKFSLYHIHHCQHR